MIQLYSNIQGLIFDCDGTLADTMPIHMVAWQKAFEDSREICNQSFLSSLRGMKDEEIILMYNKKFAKQIDPEDMVARKDAHFLKLSSSMKPIQPVIDIVHHYYQRIPMAVASGSKRDIVHHTLKVLGIQQLFNVILTADDPVAPKPAPDIFLEAAKQLGIAPANCQVFEDGDLGLKAAQLAGMKTTDIRLYIEK